MNGLTIIAKILGGTILASVSVLTIGLSTSKLGKSLLEGIVRQPEKQGLLTPNFFLIVGLIDIFAMIGIGTGLYMIIF